MNKAEFIAVVAEKNEIPKTKAKEYVEKVFEALTEALIEGDSVGISGFGKFEVVEKSEREASNPQTGERLVVPAHNAVKFKVSSVLKEAVK